MRETQAEALTETPRTVGSFNPRSNLPKTSRTDPHPHCVILIRVGREGVIGSLRTGDIIFRMKCRAGGFGPFNALLGAVFLPVFVALTALCCGQIAQGVELFCSWVAVVLSLAAAVVMALVLLSGISTWRAVVLSSTGMSIPGFSARRGFYRDDVALTDILNVQLSYRSEPRNGRWQLEITQRHGPSLFSEGITSSRNNRDATQTRAGSMVQELRPAVRAAHQRKG